MINNTIDLIICFVKSINYNKVIDDGKHKIEGTKYLLNQILRQYDIPKQNYLITKKAIDLWQQLSNDNINNYFYRDTVVCKNTLPVDVKIYKNNSNSFTYLTLNKDDKFTYKDVFHNEHIIPIEIIIRQLVDLDKNNKLDYNNVENVLSNIYICRMLKEEDRKIKIKFNRPYNLNQIIDTIYTPVGIKIVK